MRESQGPGSRGLHASLGRIRWFFLINGHGLQPGSDGLQLPFHALQFPSAICSSGCNVEVRPA